VLNGEGGQLYWTVGDNPNNDIHLIVPRLTWGWSLYGLMKKEDGTMMIKDTGMLPSPHSPVIRIPKDIEIGLKKN
jgi:hypothetical protein